MKENKIVREELERIYGNICMMHEGLRIKGYSKSKIDYKGKAIARQLTLHHIKPRRLGGRTTVENGAVLCRACHDFLEQTTPDNREYLNQLLIKYKEARIQEVDDLDTGIEIDIAEIEATPKGIKGKKKGVYNRAKQKRETRKIWEEHE